MTGGEGQILFRPFRIAAAMACTLTLPAVFMPSSPRNSQGAGAAASPLLRSVPVGRDPVALAVDARTGRVFVLGAAGSVTTLDATTGAPLRSVAVGRGAQAVAVDEATGRAFVTDPGRVFVLDARSGAVLRARSVGGGGPTGGLAVDARHGEVFVAVRGVDHGPAGSGPESIAVLDAATGQTRRTIYAYGDLLAVDGVARRIILPQQCGGDASTADACADTRDAVTGRLLKTVDFGGEEGFTQVVTAVAVDTRAGRAFVLYGDGRGDANVGALDTRTGARRTPVVGAGGSFGLIAVDERVGRVAVVTTPDNYALATGSPPSPAASVSVVNARNGDVVGGDSIPNIPRGEASPVGVAADMNGTYFYVAATPSPFATARSSHTILDVLDARTGKLLRRVTLPYAAIPLSGVESVAMAVDGRTGRLFIANGSNNTVSMLDTARL